MSIPKPLNAVNALRLHLKQLERGVNDARTRRLGPAAVPPTAPTNNLTPSYGSAMPAAPRVQATPPAPLSRQPMSYPMQPPAPAANNGKPKAKPKNGADFGSFFQNIDKREAS